MAIISLGTLLPSAMMPPSDSKFRRTVKITTVPEGASVVFIPLGENDGEPRPEQASKPATSPATFRLVPGYYLVVASLRDGRFHEVYRFVPDATGQLRGIFPHNTWEFDAASPGSGDITLVRIRIRTLTS